MKKWQKKKKPNLMAVPQKTKTRQIKSKQKRQSKKQVAIAYNNRRDALFNDLKAQNKGLSKHELIRLTDGYMNDESMNPDEYLDFTSNLKSLRFSSKDIISSIDGYVHTYEMIIDGYNEFLIDIDSYDKYSIPFLNDFLNDLREYQEELQSSQFGQNFAKASPYSTLSVISRITSETLTDLSESVGVFGMLERIKRLFEQEAKQAFYASSQSQMYDILNQNHALYDGSDDDIALLFEK